jgi:hypothetical protein
LKLRAKGLLRIVGSNLAIERAITSQRHLNSI